MPQQPASTVADGLKKAEETCRRKGIRLTRLRREILELLLAADAPVKAYDIIEQMRDRGKRITPATVYRTLDFLLQHELAHKVNALNAFVPCTGSHDKHALLMFVCSHCHQTQELDDPALYETLQAKLGEKGMSMDGSCIEIQGSCPNCS